MKALRALAGARVMVNLDNGDAIHGTIARSTGDTVDLVSARLAGPNGGALDGTVIIPSPRIAWIQVVA